MGSTDARYNGSIFRSDNPMILAARRELASIVPVALAYNSNGYLAGTCLARNTTSGQYQAYTNGGASGTGTAAGFLFFNVNPWDFASSADFVLERMVVGGELNSALLTGNDATANTQLGARSIVSATGTTILKF